VTSPRLLVSGLLTRPHEGGAQVLLVPHPPGDADSQVFALPSRELEWGADARAVLRQAFLDDAGLAVEVDDPYEVHSNVDDPDAPTTGIWFRVRHGDGDPSGGGRFVGLDALPSLARPTDQLVLWRRVRELADAEPGTDGPLRSAAGSSNRQLMDAYTKELMRGAWVNQLHLRLAHEDEPAGIANAAAAHLAKRGELTQVRIWFPGPGDRCGDCPWREPCPHTRCLHLVAEAGEASTPEEARIPLLEGYLPQAPAADVSLQAVSRRTGLGDHSFQGFPLDMGEVAPGVLGLVSREQLVAHGLYEAMASHIGTLVRGARMVQRLRTADMAKQSFIQRLSHEFKTPLTVILGFAELMKDELAGDPDSLGLMGATEIHASGEQLLKIVESILDLTKLESAASALQPTRLDMSRLLKKAAEAAGTAHNLQKRLELTVQAPDESLFACADPERVEEVLGLLLHNALKFTREGSVDVRVEQRDDEVVCHITDTGIGIHPDEQEQIFQAFYQISEAIHTEFGGIGLGLTIAQALIEAQGGAIWVESQPGQGCTVSFTLPRGARVL
jgi:signal transduction histidine kinase